MCNMHNTTTYISKHIAAPIAEFVMYFGPVFVETIRKISR